MKNGCLFGFLLILLFIGIVDTCINKIKENTPEYKIEQEQIKIEKLKQEKIEEANRLNYEKTKRKEQEVENLKILKEDTKSLIEENIVANLIRIESECQNYSMSLGWFGGSPEEVIIHNIRDEFILTGQINLFLEIDRMDKKASFQLSDISPNIVYENSEISIFCTDDSCIILNDRNSLDGRSIEYLEGLQFKGTKSFKNILEKGFKELLILRKKYQEI